MNMGLTVKKSTTYCEDCTLLLATQRDYDDMDDEMGSQLCWRAWNPKKECLAAEESWTVAFELLKARIKLAALEVKLKSSKKETSFAQEDACRSDDDANYMLDQHTSDQKKADKLQRKLKEVEQENGELRGHMDAMKLDHEVTKGYRAHAEQELAQAKKELTGFYRAVTVLDHRCSGNGRTPADCVVYACEEYIRSENALPEWCDTEDYCLSSSVETLVGLADELQKIEGLLYLAAERGMVFPERGNVVEVFDLIARADGTKKSV